MDNVLCFICRRRIPDAFKNAHHAKPQAVGGGPEDIVDLCAGCHSNTHAVSSMLKGPRAAQAEDTVRTYYQNDLAAGRRCMELAIKVVKHMSEKDSGQFKLAAHEDVELMIEIPLAVKNALMLLGREARDPKTNRRLGLAGIARTILIDYATRKFPAIKKEIQNSVEEKLKQNPDSRFAKPRRRVNDRTEAFHVETVKRAGS